MGKKKLFGTGNFPQQNRRAAQGKKATAWELNDPGNGKTCITINRGN